MSNIETSTQMLPGDVVPGARYQDGAATSVLNTRPGASKFSTTEVRPDYMFEAKTSGTVKFTKEFDEPPAMAVGLSCLDLAGDANIRVNAYADDITRDSATMAENDPDFQVGKFSTTDDHPWNHPQEKTSSRINFARPYKSSPTVIVWLSLLDMDKRNNWRVHTTASDISPNGFTIHIDTWGDSILYTATAHWIAYLGDKEGVASGSYKASDIRPWNRPMTNNSGRVEFPVNMFQNPPTVLTALNRLDIDCNRGLRVKLGTKGVSAQSMDWDIEGWHDTILYDAGASYIAFS
ncbi:hypothetical protein FHETE_1113 [Fusarium heterosporum]|uniref:H-type lectin domain-containing protein n=1 Tax=Fusarium heterosporum TaxID=42747 RepID=A0A8H5TZV7_FUSHE|nr:hypothetical protein FHETE_1113 [Fusarium heterosporum]